MCTANWLAKRSLESPRQAIRHSLVDVNEEVSSRWLYQDGVELKPTQQNLKWDRKHLSWTYRTTYDFLDLSWLRGMAGFLTYWIHLSFNWIAWSTPAACESFVSNRYTFCAKPSPGPFLCRPCEFMPMQIELGHFTSTTSLPQSCSASDHDFGNWTGHTWFGPRIHIHSEAPWSCKSCRRFPCQPSPGRNLRTLVLKWLQSEVLFSPHELNLVFLRPTNNWASRDQEYDYTACVCLDQHYHTWHGQNPQ